MSRLNDNKRKRAFELLKPAYVPTLNKDGSVTNDALDKGSIVITDDRDTIANLSGSTVAREIELKGAKEKAINFEDSEKKRKERAKAERKEKAEAALAAIAAANS